MPERSVVSLQNHQKTLYFRIRPERPAAAKKEIKVNMVRHLPVIGINTAFTATANPAAPARHEVQDTYVRAIREAGGLPLLLPNHPLTAIECNAYLDRLDGLLFIGGLDYPPEYYGEKADEFTQTERLNPESDLILARAALQRALPLFGICGGEQLLTIADGGKLIVHLANSPEIHQDGRRHAAAIIREGHLSRALGLNCGDIFTVNSFHHQAVDPAAPGARLVITARAADGSVEAIEGSGSRFILGTQFHPERLPELGRPLFAAFVAAARQ